MESNFTPSEPFNSNAPVKMPFSIYSLFRNIGIALVFVIAVLWIYRQFSAPAIVSTPAVVAPVSSVAVQSPSTVAADPPLIVQLGAVMEDGTVLNLSFAVVGGQGDYTLIDVDGDKLNCDTLPKSVGDLEDCVIISLVQE